MKKVRFSEQGDEVVLPSTKGVLETSEYWASVDYRFEDDDAVVLTIDDQCFGQDDIDELIAFLTAAKAKLK